MKKPVLSLVLLFALLFNICSCSLIDLPDLGGTTEETTTISSEESGETGSTAPESPSDEESTTASENTTTEQTTDPAEETTTAAPMSDASMEELLAAMSSYTVTIITTDDDGYEYMENYVYDNGKMMLIYQGIDGNDYIEYFTKDADGKLVYYSDYVAVEEFNTYFVIKENSPYFEDFFASYFHGIDVLESADFNKVGDDYTLVGGNVNDIAKAMLYDQDGEYIDDYYGDSYTITEKFKTITVSQKDGKISEIVATSDYIMDGSSYATTYTLTFSEIGSSSVNLPTNVKELTDEVYNEYFGNWDDDVDTPEGSTTEGSASSGTTGEQIEAPEEFTKPVLDSNVFDETAYVGIPSTGTSNILVIPVQFTNDKFTSDELSKMKLAFEGTYAEAGWYSLKSYYETSSYGKLNLSFTYADPYTVNKTYADFESDYNYYYTVNDYSQNDPVENIIDAVLAQYDRQYNYADYDSNSDNMIDGIYLIYSAPVDYYYYSDLYWAWTTMSYSDVEFDGRTAGYYVWCGVETFDEALVPYDNDAFSVYVEANATTLIHETGHMLGLPDYYDTDNTVGPAGGVGGGDMMDTNVGDHCAASKYLLGWVDPKIGASSISSTFTIGSLSSTGDCILVKLANGTGFDLGRYLIIDFYTPDGINEQTAGLAGQPEEACVRIFEVNAQLGLYEYSGQEYYGYINNNGTTDTKFIRLVEADGNNSIESTSVGNDGNFAEMSDYFTNGSSIEFKYTASDGSHMSCDITVHIDEVAKTATVEIVGAVG